VRIGWAVGGGATMCPSYLKKIGLNLTRINEVVGIFADCEGSEPEGERALQSAAQD